MKQNECRFCATPLVHGFVDLGLTPLANAYLSEVQLSQPEPTYPLRAFVCHECWLVQADAFVPPEDIFSNYAYFSSYSLSWVEHARRFTVMARERFSLTPASQVVEVASNDGYLLRHFVEAGIPVLGVEPAENVAQTARAIGVPTECLFFGRDTACKLVKAGGAADLVIGNNVLAHVPDINDFVGGLAGILKPDGVVSVEFPHLLRLMQETQFDTVYHEHFYYLSLLAVERIFATHGLRVFDVEQLPTHGGSLRVMVCLASSSVHSVSDNVAHVRQVEDEYGFRQVAVYEGFQAQVAPIRDGLLAFLDRAKAQSKTVVAYGAAAKGNTLLNFCGVGTDHIAYVVDRNPHKQGHYLPGSHLPILAPEKMLETKPDYVLILPWNLKNEIVSDYDLSAWGGRYVIAIPELTVL